MTPDSQTPPRARAWLALPLAAAVQLAAVWAMLHAAGGAEPVTVALLTAVLTGMALLVGTVFGEPAWASVLCVVGSASGWFFGVSAGALIGLPEAHLRATTITSLIGGGLFGTLLGLWALDYPVRAMHAVALTCVSGLPAAVSQAPGCLAGTLAAAAGPAVLCAAMAAKIVWDRRRLREQTRPILWPPGVAARAVPRWYLRPAWACAFTGRHYLLAAAFVVLQLAILPLLLDRFWTWPPSLRDARASETQWIALAVLSLLWCLLWTSSYPLRRPPVPPPARPADALRAAQAPQAHQPMPPDAADAQPPPAPQAANADEPDAAPHALAPGAHADTGWSLVGLCALFALSIEFVAVLHKAGPAAPAFAGMAAMLVILTVLMAVIVLVLVVAAPAVGKVRFSLFSVLYSLAVLTALAQALFAFWLKALAES